MKSIFVLFSLLFLSTHGYSADVAVGSKCLPLGPLSATTPVNLVRCACESAGFIGGATMNTASSNAYSPRSLVEVDQWPDYHQLISTRIYPDNFFVTLVKKSNIPSQAVTDGEKQYLEIYNFYQGADDESGADQFLMSTVTVLVTHYSRSVSCSIAKVVPSNMPQFLKYE